MRALVLVMLVGCGSGAICGKRQALTSVGGGPSQGDRTCEVRK
jgi:hypothetical protein